MKNGLEKNMGSSSEVIRHHTYRGRFVDVTDPLITTTRGNSSPAVGSIAITVSYPLVQQQRQKAPLKSAIHGAMFSVVSLKNTGDYTTHLYRDYNKPS